MKTKNAAYWISTTVVCGFAAYASFAYLTRDAKIMGSFSSLGYPDYFPAILGVAKILGILALIFPGAPRVKEWAYAGFTFIFIGAACSHLASGQDKAAVMPAANLVMLVISYICRPATRRLAIESEAEIHPTPTSVSTIR